MGAFLDAINAARSAPPKPAEPPFPSCPEEERLLALFMSRAGYAPERDRLQICRELRDARAECHGDLAQLEAMILLAATRDVMYWNFLSLICQHKHDTARSAPKERGYYDAPATEYEGEDLEKPRADRRKTAGQLVMRWLRTQGTNKQERSRPCRP
jgi:hypothetical protein